MFVAGYLPRVSRQMQGGAVYVNVVVMCLLQGIYRVSAVKSKVERLCQSFETDCEEVDLSEHHPNVIANVLKLYLRQVGDC